MLLTGDIAPVANRVGARLGIAQVVAELMRRGLDAPTAGAGGDHVGEPPAVYSISPVTGLPVVLGASRPITDEDVKALEDEG